MYLSLRKLIVVAGVFIVILLNHLFMEVAASNEIFKLQPDDGAEGDEFGGAISVSETIAIVGARFDDDFGNNSGSAYLFDAALGNQLFKLAPSDSAADDWFGISVGISGSTAVVGAYQDDNIRGIDAGSAYLFDVSSGAEGLKLTASDGSANDNFGISVDIEGSLAIIGAYRDGGIGSAYVFDTVTGRQLAKLTPSDGAKDDNFGASVGISGNIAIVGAGSQGSQSGAAYVFDVTTGNQIRKLTGSDTNSGDYFGLSVAIDGAIAVVGAPFNDDSGSVYVFDALTGNELYKLFTSDGSNGDRFGIEVDIDGNSLIAGAYLDDDNGFASGSAYVFDVFSGSEIKKLTASDGDSGDQLGIAVGIESNLVVVGAWNDEGSTGSTSGWGSSYVFQIPEPTTCAFALGVFLLHFSRRGQTVPCQSGYFRSLL